MIIRQLGKVALFGLHLRTFEEHINNLCAESSLLLKQSENKAKSHKALTRYCLL